MTRPKKVNIYLVSNYLEPSLAVYPYIFYCIVPPFIFHNGYNERIIHIEQPSGQDPTI